jgi:hypothetical protein
MFSRIPNHEYQILLTNQMVLMKTTTSKQTRIVLTGEKILINSGFGIDNS